MTSRTKYMTTFEQCGIAVAESVIETERGLGKSFEAAVRELLTEHNKSSTPEVKAAFIVAMEAMEEEARKVLEQHFGEGATLSKEMPAWKAYKSAYKALISKMGAEANTLPSLGIAAVKKKVAELNKGRGDDTGANKGPEASNDGGDAATGSTDAGSSGGSKGSGPKLDPKVQKKLDHAIQALAQMDAEEAYRIVNRMDSIAWSAYSGGNRKAATTTKVA